jgi:hypothetical protein
MFWVQQYAVVNTRYSTSGCFGFKSRQWLTRYYKSGYSGFKSTGRLTHYSKPGCSEFKSVRWLTRYSTPGCFWFKSMGWLKHVIRHPGVLGSKLCSDLHTLLDTRMFWVQKYRVVNTCYSKPGCSEFKSVRWLTHVIRHPDVLGSKVWGG